MKAARIHSFGPPDVVVVEEAPVPSPGPGEVLVRVMAAGIALWDAIIREGKSKVSPQPPLTLGSDLSGVVEKVGPGVTDFALADQVYGVTNPQFCGAMRCQTPFANHLKLPTFQPPPTFTQSIPTPAPAIPKQEKKVSTPNRADINRANAQHSTGPKTEAGKLKSSLNALRHGLTGQLVVMPTEDLAAYQLHLKSFTDEYHPQGATEANMVQAPADASWRLNRAAAMEANYLTLFAANASDPISEAESTAAALERQSKTMSNISMYTQRLARQFEKTAAQLRNFQKIRQDQEKHDLNELLDVMQMHKDKGIP